jgi:hypothetical protein
MTDTPLPKRKVPLPRRQAASRHQFHRSTLIILSLMATMFVCLSVLARSVAMPGIALANPGSPDDAPFSGRGWPSVFEAKYDDAHNHRYVWDWDALALDSVVCIGSLAAGAVAIEWLTRRMKRKPTP